jgi:preprotein translocase subunit YajC
MPVASAIDTSYNIIVEDNGNSLVIIELSSQGLITLNIPDDVNDVKVKGALYKLNDDNTIDISIGSTNKALVLYQTALMTTKQGSEWLFNAKFDQKSNLQLALPKNVLVKLTNPEAFIENSNYTKINFVNITSAEAKYHFTNEIIEPSISNKNKIIDSFWLFIIIGIIIFIGMLYYVLRPKKQKSSKNNVIKTLSKNERIVVNMLIENNGEMKRNQLELKSKIAKSSLANTLNNLQNKKILSIDKTYTTHYIKLERWFHEL